MAKDFVIGLSAVFLLWVGGIFIASTKLVWDNWQLFRRWRAQPRTMRLRMAMWLAIPLITCGLFWMRSVAVWNYLTVVNCCSTMVIVQMLTYMPFILAAFGLILWWVFDRTFAARYSEEFADQLWYAYITFGLIMGVVAAAASTLLGPSLR